MKRVIPFVETSQHNSELKPLMLAEERARLAIESAELGAYELDLVNDLMQTTPRTDEIFGFTGPMPRNAYLSAIHPEDIPVRNLAQVDALRTGRLFYEARIFWPDNTIHWIRVTGTIFFNGKQPVSLLGIIQDISEQRKYEEALSKEVEERTKDLVISNNELKIINAELQQYVQVSSHDLQEPLRKIRLYIGMIMSRDEDKLSEVSKTHFAKIAAAAERLSTSLRDLLNFNSINKEDLYVNVDINEVIKMAENDLELIISQKSAVITVSKLPTIRAIPVQMNQLFYNLINNALKFAQSETPPVVSIISHKLSSQYAQQYHHLDGSKKYVEIVVKDNGIGFDQHNAEKIFDMFQRLHDRRVFGGTGIGLALCKKVVQNHGGKLWASSAPGKGASFHVILPID